MKAILALADGRVFIGKAFGAWGGGFQHQYDRISGNSDRSFLLR